MTMVSHFCLGLSFLISHEWVALGGVTYLLIKVYSIIQYIAYDAQYHIHIIHYAMHSLCCTVQNTQCERECSEYLGVDPLGSSLAMFYFSVEVHRQHELRAGLLPGVSMPEPIICLFYLQKGQGLEFTFQEFTFQVN